MAHPGTVGTPHPANPAKLVVFTSRPAPWTRTVSVFVPAQYVPGTVVPFIVDADGPDPLLFTTLENLIAQRRLPVMIGIAVGNGGGDAQGSQRGREYDTLSARYAEFIEKDVLAQVERRSTSASRTIPTSARRWAAVQGRRPRWAWRGIAPP